MTTRLGVCEVPYNVSVRLAVSGAVIFAVTMLLGGVYYWAGAAYFHWVQVDSASSLHTVFKLRGPVLDAYFGFPVIASGLLVVAAGVPHFAVLGVELLFDRTRVVKWKSIGIWAGFAVATIGVGGIFSYTQETSHSLTIDRPSETLVIEKSFIFKDRVHDVIPFDDVMGVRYEYEVDSSEEWNIENDWVYLTVRGREEKMIASGVAQRLRVMAEAISNSTGVPLTVEIHCDDWCFLHH